jgi:hypothetical protein
MSFPTVYVIKLNGYYIGKRSPSHALMKWWRKSSEQGRDDAGYAPSFWVEDIKRAKIWNDHVAIRRFVGLNNRDAPFPGYTVEGSDGSSIPLDDILKM